jgi:hypothetical protein
MEYASMKYGNEHEDDAFKEYASEDVVKSGLWVNPTYPELGCSLDGIILNPDRLMVGVLEITCPSTLEKNSPLDIDTRKKNQISNACYKLRNVVARLKRTHKYYHYQVQM